MRLRPWVRRLPRRLYFWLRRMAWPLYECQLCVGQEYWQGCYCAYHGAIAPGGPGPKRWRRTLRWALSTGDEW